MWLVVQYCKVRYSSKLDRVFYCLDELESLLLLWDADLRVIIVGSLGQPYRVCRADELRKFSTEAIWFAIVAAESIHEVDRSGVLPADRIMVSNSEMFNSGISESIFALTEPADVSSDSTFIISKVYKSLRAKLKKICIRGEIVNSSNGKSYRCLVSEGALPRFSMGYLPIDGMGPTSGGRKHPDVLNLPGRQHPFM